MLFVRSSRKEQLSLYFHSVKNNLNATEKIFCLHLFRVTGPQIKGERGTAGSGASTQTPSQTCVCTLATPASSHSQQLPGLAIAVQIDADSPLPFPFCLKMNRLLLCCVALLLLALPASSDAPAFEDLDANRDGLINRSEYANYLSKLRGGRSPAIGQEGATDGEDDWGFYNSMINSFAMIVVTELGDKTFFIAAILAMRHGRLVVFAGCMAALVVMHVLSSLMGLALPALLPKVYTHYASTVSVIGSSLPFIQARVVLKILLFVILWVAAPVRLLRREAAQGGERVRRRPVR